MLITEFVNITITSFNKKYFENLGYDISVGQVLTIPVNHLSKGSHVIVEVKCDYCGEIFQKAYKEYLGQIKNINKNSCVKCSKKKIKDVSLFLYGTENPMQSREVQDKQKSTMMKKYGVEYASQTEQAKFKMSEYWSSLSELELNKIKEKTKQTCLERYGVENPLQAEEIKLKGRQTCLDKYGVEYPNQNKEMFENYKNTCLNKYGVDNYFKTNEFNDKKIKTCNEKYGVDNYSQTEEFKKNISEYWTNISDSDLQEITNKKEQTCLDKYGYKHPSQVPEIQEKTEQTCIERYGVKSVLCLPEVREKGLDVMIEIGGVPVSNQQICVYEILKNIYNDNVIINYKYKHYILDIALFVNKLKIDIEYDGWYWHKDKVEKDTNRNEFLINDNWKVLRIKSRYNLPTIEQLQEKLNILINTDEMYQEIILDDWKEKEVAV